MPYLDEAYAEAAYRECDPLGLDGYGNEPILGPAAPLTVEALERFLAQIDVAAVRRFGCDGTHYAVLRLDALLPRIKAALGAGQDARELLLVAERDHAHVEDALNADVE